LLGRRNDIPRIMSALDLHVLSSAFGEAFPNVVAEAMSCGTPCVVTDVGDAADIVGDMGWVVPPRDAPALAEAITTALGEMSDAYKSHERRLRARQRIEEKFSIERMVDAYSECWNEVVKKVAGCA
jgi:glycosyltransferase involved in cell wall biosynthesis